MHVSSFLIRAEHAEIDRESVFFDDGFERMVVEHREVSNPRICGLD